MFAETGLSVRNYGAGTSMPLHDHAEASLSIVVHGGLLERVRGSERAHGRGHVAFCPAAVAHGQTFGERGARQVIVTPTGEQLDYLEDCNLELQDAPYSRAPIFRRLGDRLLQELRTEDAFSAVAREGVVLEVVAAFGRDCTGERASERLPAWLSAARDFIHAYGPQPLRLAQIARAAGRHEIHLAREFRRHFGVSVGAYQRRLRVERAAELLAGTSLRLSEIALECGFSSHAHMCREMKLQLGLTPSELRSGALS